MNPILSEWLGLAIRWIHVITGIAWIGASFYFNWLLNHLIAAREGEEKGEERVVGELWAVHAGGFFKVQKRTLPPGQLPDPLHWFKWEAYWTWISGFALLVLVYYAGASAYLIDPAVADIRPATAIAIGIGSLVGSWFVYDGLWRSPLAHNRALCSAISCLLLVGLAWGLSRVFSGRGAYIHVGAVLGTLMVGNVHRVIMPAQRQLVAATQSGAEQDRALTRQAELRSLHNNYLTLPVLFVMISNHYPMTYGYRWNWVVLLVLFAVGAAVRHYFNVRHRRGNLASAWLLVLPAAVVALLAWFTAPAALAPDAAARKVSFARVQAVIDRRCVTCHSAHPTSPLFTSPPKDVMFDTASQIAARAAQIRTQVVVTRAMPLGNLTHMTREERELVARWIDQGGGTH